MQLKDMYNQQYVADVATAVLDVYPDFDATTFSARVFDADWDRRELKDRMRHIALTLHDFLPADYPVALDILRQASVL